MASKRIPFIEAINEPRLLKHRFGELSLPQQVILKVLYGCDLSAAICDNLGWSELDYWAMLNESCVYDDLGYLVSVTPIAYNPAQYRELWAIWGRRSGKTDALSSTIVAYEATCGGHEDFLRSGQKGVVFQIAQDTRLAKYSLHFITATLDDSPLLKKMKKSVTSDRIELVNNITIAVVPPTLKSVRGFATPVAVLDEVGVWYQDSDSANPDYEIYRAVSPGMVQFPDRKIVGISSPWNKAGLLYRFYEAGTNGAKIQNRPNDEFKNVLVSHATTAGVNNPRIDKSYLIQERSRDPRAFERECLATFYDSISGFLPSTLVNKSVDDGVTERPPDPTLIYVAAMDPAFKNDAFGFTIVHQDLQGKIIQDVVRRWVGTKNSPLNPEIVLAAIADLCNLYKNFLVYTDQYQLESLQQIASKFNLVLCEVAFTGGNKATIFGDLQQMIHQGRLRLLDDYETLKELKTLERKLTGGGAMQISAPSGLHDDMAAVLAIAVHKALWFNAPIIQAEMPKEPTPFELCQATIKKEATDYDSWD